MKRWRCLLLFLTLSAGALLTSLPSAEAQRPPGCCCSGSMQVHTYYIQQKWLVQQQQQQMQMHVMHQQKMMHQVHQIHQARIQQAQYRQQQQQYRQQQQQHRQQQQQHRQQQELIAKARMVQQHKTHVAIHRPPTIEHKRPVGHLTRIEQARTETRAFVPPRGSGPGRMLPRVLKTEAHHLKTETRHLTETARTLHDRPVRLAMAPRVIRQEARRLHTEPRAIHTEARKLHIEPRAIHTEARKLNTQSRALTTTARTLNTESRKLVTESTKITKTDRWCVKTIKVTEITYNLNCGQCHANKKKRSPEPLLANGPPRRRLPEPLLANGPPRRRLPEPLLVKGPPRGRLPEPLLSRRPALTRSPTAIALTRQPSRLPTAIPGSRRRVELARMREPLAQPRDPGLLRYPQTREPIAQGNGPRRRPTDLREVMLPNLPGTPFRRPLSFEPLGMPGLPPGPAQLALAEPWAPLLPGERPGLLLPFDQGQYPLWQPGDEPLPRGMNEPRSGKKRPTKTAPEAVALDDTSHSLPATVLQSPSLPLLSKAGFREAIAEDGSLPEAAPRQDQGESQATEPFRRPLSNEELQAPDLPPLPASIIVPPPVVEEDEGEDLGVPGAPPAPQTAPRRPTRLAGSSSAPGT